MYLDIERESKGEVKDLKRAMSRIGSATARLYKNKIKVK